MTWSMKFAAVVSVGVGIFLLGAGAAAWLGATPIQSPREDAAVVALAGSAFVLLAAWLWRG